MALGWAADRGIQYRAAEIRALKVTITSSASGATHQKVFGPEAMRLATSGASFAFEVLHLLPGTYTARVDAFLDAGATIAIGEAAAPPFVVAPNATVRVAFPSLTLAATPVGSWRIRIAASAGNGIKLESLNAELAAVDGAKASLPPEPAKSSRVFTWDNVAAPAGGVSTTSVTMTATKGNQTFIQTQVATASMMAGQRVTSRLSFTFQ